MANLMGRVGVLVFSAIFAVAFGVSGYFAGLRPLGQTLWAAWQVRQWQPVSAQVLSAELEQRRDSEGTVTYAVKARYRYAYGGSYLESTRVGLDAHGGADNIDDWHAQWHRRLRQAQDRKESITVYANPGRPAESLIDPSIRWRLQVVRLPFALVFTAVGLVAAWIFVRVLLGRSGGGRSDGAGVSEDTAPRDFAGSSAGLAAPRSSLQGTATMAWVFSLLWCGMAFSMAAVIWSDRSASGVVKGFIGMFVVVGLGLLYLAVLQSRKVWRYRGASFTSLPHQPQAGCAVEVTLLLSQRAAMQPGARALRLRLAQYRVDEASSGSPERQVQAVDAVTVREPLPDGGLRLVARFGVPEDAPTHGAKRSGERVDWRVDLLGPEGSVELSYDLNVKAALQGSSGAAKEDRFDRSVRWEREESIALPEGEAESLSVADWPIGAVLKELPHAVQIHFGQQAWRWGAGIALVLLAMEWGINDRIGMHGVEPPRSWGGLCVAALLLAFALHAATRRWVLSVQDDGIVARRSSWLWSTAVSVPGDASRSLVHKVMYATGSGSSELGHHAVFARDARGTLVQLTPAMVGPEAATAVGQAIAQAWQDRRGSFSPGAQRPLDAEHSRPAGGWLLIVALLVGLWWAPRISQSVGGGAPLRVWTGPDGRLMDAQNAGDAAALEEALRDGANPDLLADSGSSVLMLASHRGQMAHVELLLRAGAQPDLRQTKKDSERGDTALLRAFYGGHLAVAQRLVQAGASLQARNRWDWGPVHMAAQSGCVPCLQWLAEREQPLDEPAPASRGETPAMLAAAKGKVPVLQWMEERGIDLWRRDLNGKTALDWARMGQQADAERWLQERQR